MIYPSEADIIPFVKSITQSLQPYSQANEVQISFSCVINLLFKGHMEYAIISFLVGENIFSWLFHLVLKNR
jgi:hypothetical protein